MASRPTAAGVVSELLRFGAGVTGFNIRKLFALRLDNVLIGRCPEPNSSASTIRPTSFTSCRCSR